MNFLSKAIWVYLFSVAILNYIICSDLKGINVYPAKEITRVEDIRAIIGLNLELSNCACVKTFQCKGPPRQAPPMLEKCSGTGEICCLTEDIESSTLNNLLLHAAEETKGVPTDNEELDDCTCLTEAVCITTGGTVSTFGPNSPDCPDPSFACCILPISDVDIIAGIIGIGEPFLNYSETSDNCRCIPEERCSQDLSSFVNERTSAVRHICESKTEICCNEIDILDETILIPDSSCECVPTHRCSLDLSSIVNKRSSAGSIICNSSSLVCCDKTDIIEEQPLPKSPDGGFPEDIPSKTPETQLPHNCSCVPKSLCSDIKLVQQSVTQAARCVETEVCCQKPKEFQHSLRCGQSHETNSAIDIRIRLGSRAKFAEFPWMVAIFEVDSKGVETYKCGGSLIHPSVVLTTAHCVVKESRNILKIRAGDLDIKSTRERISHVEKDVVSRLIHPSFSSRTLRFNYAMLYLDSAIRLQYHINTICLPESRDFQEYARSCTATGWGKSEFGDLASLQSILKKVTLSLVEAEQCEKSLQKTRLGSKFRLDSTAICAGGSIDDTCTGDGGSPLVCVMNDGSNRYMQVGAVAWGIECGKENVPGVYASSFAAIEWIKRSVTHDFGNNATEYFT